MAELQPQTISIQTIYSWFNEGKLFVNRRYQRKLVWTLLEKQKLIESIIRKYPIPAVLLAEREDQPGTYEIIDGLQRLHAIMSFIENEYFTLDEKFFDVEQLLTAKNRASEGHFKIKQEKNNLSPKDISTILDYSLAMSIMRNASESEINDVFDRINTYGHRLSDQERRQAGVQSKFSNMVREIACSNRGDSSDNILPLERMPSISIDLPLMKHGYNIISEEVFWVKHGILRSTDLRDSLDEQCIADISASIVGDKLIPRSKDALDRIYNNEDKEHSRIETALDVYSETKFSEEFKFCIQEIENVCDAIKKTKLRDLIFKESNTNAFPAVFATIFIAFYELIIKDKKRINNYAGVKENLTGIAARLDTSRAATLPDERRKNINAIKGAMQDNFIKGIDESKIYNNHKTTDIDEILRRSEIELANYELKQGLLTLNDDKTPDENIHDKIFSTLCGIANIGRGNESGIVGKLLIGVTDKDADAERVHKLYDIEPRVAGTRKVVGIKREAAALNISVEEYYRRLCRAIQKSELSEPLKSEIISLIDYNDFYGYGVIIITIPLLKSYSSYKKQIYHRVGDNTKIADPLESADIAIRFSR